MVPLKERRRGGGTRLLSAGMRRTAIASDPPPTHLQTSMRNLAAPEGDRRFGRKVTRVGVHPDGSTLTPEGIAMQSILDLGADVDSRFIVVACAADSFRPQRIANARKAILEWLRTVPRGSRLGMESTGSYHELLAELACKAGLQVFVINARDSRAATPKASAGALRLTASTPRSSPVTSLANTANCTPTCRPPRRSANWHSS